MNEQPQKLDTHFIKNNEFRTVYGSGFYGGFTPAGLLNMFVYTERVPIPTRITYQVDSDDERAGKEVERDAKPGIVREVQFGVLLDIEVAERLVDWLQGKINDYNQTKTHLSQQSTK